MTEIYIKIVMNVEFLVLNGYEPSLVELIINEAFLLLLFCMFENVQNNRG